LTETPTPIPDLIAQLSDPDQAVRQAAAIALGVRCGRALARQLSHDLKRLEHVLALIRP
jgi:HEAT repeat protein